MIINFNNNNVILLYLVKVHRVLQKKKKTLYVTNNIQGFIYPIIRINSKCRLGYSLDSFGRSNNIISLL